MKGRTVLIVLGVVFLGVGIGISTWGSSVLKNAKASSSWPIVEGKVVASDVERERSTSGTGGERRTSTTYKANVFYEYSVDGTKYSSDKVSFGEYSSSNQRHARQIVNRYRKGKIVQVYYNPGKPDVAVLEPGVSWSSYMPLGMGVVFAIAGTAAFIGGIVGKKRGSQ
jgi:hypothetical protein